MLRSALFLLLLVVSSSRPDTSFVGLTLPRSPHGDYLYFLMPSLWWLSSLSLVMWCIVQWLFIACCWVIICMTLASTIAMLAMLISLSICDWFVIANHLLSLAACNWCSRHLVITTDSELHAWQMLVNSISFFWRCSSIVDQIDGTSCGCTIPSVLPWTW